MVIKPKIRGFICTTAHPLGCAENVKIQVEYAKANPIKGAPKRVLVIGSSTGYGLACRIAAAFCCEADTIGVFFEREASSNRTATAGWYNNREFERLAKDSGRIAESINGDAFADDVKQETIRLIKGKLPGGKVDLIIYSLAAPKRRDPVTGGVYSSVIKPIGDAYKSKTVDFHTGIIHDVTIEPAAQDEIAGTVKVMGGEDWLLWIKAMTSAGVIEQNAVTAAFSYIGPSLTFPVYKNGTIGTAKEDLEEKAKQITSLLSTQGGKAFVAVNKALVTQASSAIPVVPLYISILYKLMKKNGTHEDCIRQMARMFKDRLYAGEIPVDEAGRIRMDDWEMQPALQEEVGRIWGEVTNETVGELTDIDGYRDDFMRLFGFGFPDIDYDADVKII
ncbi:MAG: trans-2-enoyl-CoA reductase family protein [Oscillospiraceae bacterium]|nr:trans-2-enoyl-CoA reductase family protein [Oscillospiraceae bacterium]